MSWTPTRWVEVCGTPTAIALDAERDENKSKRGYVLQTTYDNVVLRSADSSLRTVNAQRFCMGVLDVRHVMQLPPNVTFNERSWNGKFGVAWGNSEEDSEKEPAAVYIMDFQAGELTAKPLPSLNEKIADAFVDAKGDRVAVVGATTGNLYAFNQSGWNYREPLKSRSQSEWRIVNGTAIDKDVADCVYSCGRFTSSAVMGDCFVFLRTKRDSTGFLVVEKWIFDVDFHWYPVSFSSRVLGASASNGLALFVTDDWKFAIVTTENSLYHCQVDQDLRSSPVKYLTLDHRILDGTWIDQDSAFAMLLANGQISIASVSDEGCFECLAISSTSTVSKRLSLSALLGKAAPSALQLVWVEQEKQAVVDFGATCVAVKLEIIADESSSNIADKWADLSSTGAFATWGREVLTGFDDKSSDFSECIRELLERNFSPSPSKLIHLAKSALSRSQNVFEDSYFMLLCHIHQQLAGESVNNGNSRDPIECIGRSLKLMEMLVSLTISMEVPTIRQISSRMLSTLPASSTKADRKVYYVKEIAVASLQARKLLSGVSEREDWWVYSTKAATFLRVYAQTTRDILHEIQSRGKLTPGTASQISSLCQRIVEYEEGSSAVGSIDKADRMSDPLMERLRGLVASYTLLCCQLHVNGVMIDLEHIFSLMLSDFLKRKEMLCCFLRPWVRRIGDRRPVVSETKAAIHQVVRFAAESNTLHLLVDFCMASKSSISHSCVQELCKAAAIHAKLTGTETLSGDTWGNLHWKSCETYIGEAMAILHRIGAYRQFKYSNREAECIVERVSVGIGTEFDGYHQSLLAEEARTTAKSCKKSSLWEFSHLDKYLRARVIFIISQIVWHLETTSEEDIGSLFQHAFVMGLFNAQLESPSEDKGKLRECFTEVRAIISSGDSELRLPIFRLPKNDHQRLSLRAQKVSRSLVLIALALWLREKAAYCSRGVQIGKDMQTESNETEVLGALAATCAFHLNSLGIIFGDNEELHVRQLSLLENAVSMNPTKTVKVIAWGLPAQKIPTRLLRRYKGLRKVAQHSSKTVSVEEREMHCQQLQARVRRLYQCNLHIQELTSSDLNTLVNCCCDPEFLQIMSILAKCPYEAVTTSDKNYLHEATTAVFEPRDVQIMTPARTATEQTPDCMTDQVQIIESSISRDEVIALLQAQTRHLEERIHAVAAVGRSEEAQIEEIIEGKHTISELQSDKADTTREAAVDLADVQKMARISLQVRDLSRHRYSSASTDASKQAKPLSKPAQRHDSVRNALKLFRLRQENCGRSFSDMESSATANGNETRNIGNGINSSLKTEANRDTRSPSVSQRPDKDPPPKNQRNSEKQRVLAKKPVYPLRLEYGIDNASLKLLGRNAQQRNLSVKRRQFVHQERERPPKAYSSNPRARQDSVKSTNVVQLKTVSAQTNVAIEASMAPVSAAKETNESVDTQQNDFGPEKGSPLTQECEVAPHCSVSVNVNNTQKGVGIPCRLSESGSSNHGRRKRSPPPLSIVDKYPVWVDLNGGSHFKEKKYLQVAHFGDSNAADPTKINDDSALTVIVPRYVNAEDGKGDESQTDGQRSPSVSSGHSQENDTAEQIGEAMKAIYRTRYRQHYPVRERLNSRGSEDREVTSGVNSLIDLRNNMQQMTQRLRVLETCANSIDEEFKISQKRLSRIGDQDGSSSKVLENIDEVLEMTEKVGRQEGKNKPRRGLLSMKASSDMEAAKKILETIEQLTTSQ